MTTIYISTAISYLLKDGEKFDYEKEPLRAFYHKKYARVNIMRIASLMFDKMSVNAQVDYKDDSIELTDLILKDDEEYIKTEIYKIEEMTIE
jgi:hypothetical protein